MHACENAHVYRGGQKTVIPQDLSTLFLDRVFLWSGACSLDQTDWPVANKIYCVSLPLLGLLSQANTSGYFMWVLGMLARKALYQLSPLAPPEDLSVILLCSYMYIIAIAFGSKTWFILAFAYEKLGELTGHACIRNKWQPSSWLGRWAQLGLLDATCKCNKCLLP